MAQFVGLHSKIVVYGTGDFSDVVSYVIEDKLGGEVAGYVLDRQYLPADTDQYQGKPLYAFDDLAARFPADEYGVFIGFIGKKMFSFRQKAFMRLKEMGYGLPNVVHPTAAVDSDKIGDGNLIMHNACIERHCQVGDCNIIWQNVVFPHHNIVGSFNNFGPCASLSGYSVIGSNCFIGGNSAISNKVVVSNQAFIGANSLITKNVGEQEVWVPTRSYSLENKTSFDFL